MSFVIRHAGPYLHHNFVVALLNDLFGIQARGGCSCAGPYGHRLLGIDLDASHAFEREIARGCDGIKPGWVRVNFNYFIDDRVFTYILDAVDMVATDGWKLLPWYRFDPASGGWRHAGAASEVPMSLTEVRFDGGRMRHPVHGRHEPVERLTAYLDEARALFASPPAPPAGSGVEGEVGPDFDALRWFWLPGEAASELATSGSESP